MVLDEITFTKKFIYNFYLLACQTCRQEQNSQKFLLNSFVSNKALEFFRIFHQKVFY